MNADLDTLATALHATPDDLLKAFPERGPSRPKVGNEPLISDALLVALSVMQALLGHVSETRRLRFAHAPLRHLFPCLPQQSGYHKRCASSPHDGLAGRRAGPRQHMLDRPTARFFKPLRRIIESVNDTPKGQLGLEAHGGRSPAGVVTRVLQRLLALWHNDHTGQPAKRSMLAYDH